MCGERKCNAQHVEHPVADVVQRPPRVFSIVLAGGEGKRLLPLTRDRAKPAVPFGGIYRLIDFALSNLVNGGYRHIVVLTQYKSHSLDRHIAQTWRLSHAAGQLRRPRCRPRCAAAALVLRLCRRHLPEPQPDRRRATRLRDRLRRRPHLPHGPAPDGRPPHRLRRRRDRRRDSCSARAGQAVRCRSRSTATASSPSRRSRATPPACRTPRTRCTRRWATTCSPPTSARRVSGGRRRRDSAHDIGGNIIPRLVEARYAALYDFRATWCPALLTPTAATGATSARWTPSTTRTWTCLGPAVSTCTTSTGRSTRSTPAATGEFVFDNDGRRGQALDSF